MATDKFVKKISYKCVSAAGRDDIPVDVTHLQLSSKRDLLVEITDEMFPRLVYLSIKLSPYEDSALSSIRCSKLRGLKLKDARTDYRAALTIDCPKLVSLELWNCCANLKIENSPVVEYADFSDSYLHFCDEKHLADFFTRGNLKTFRNGFVGLVNMYTYDKFEGKATMSYREYENAMASKTFSCRGVKNLRTDMYRNNYAAKLHFPDVESLELDTGRFGNASGEFADVDASKIKSLCVLKNRRQDEQLPADLLYDMSELESLQVVKHDFLNVDVSRNPMLKSVVLVGCGGPGIYGRDVPVTEVYLPRNGRSADAIMENNPQWV